MEPKGKPGSFSAYIKAGREPERRQQSAAEPPKPIDLLKLLARENGSMTLERLGALSRLDSATFRQNLKSLQSSGLISITGPSLEETVTISDTGSKVVTLAS
jgi:hypothetical protein